MDRSLCSVGFAVGGLFIPAVVWALETFEWRTAVGSAVIVLVVALPLSSVFGPSPASRHGRSASRAVKWTSETPSALGGSRAGPPATRAFWLLSFGHAWRPFEIATGPGVIATWGLPRPR